jgi:hypothetical protein
LVSAFDANAPTTILVLILVPDRTSAGDVSRLSSGLPAPVIVTFNVSKTAISSSHTRLWIQKTTFRFMRRAPGGQPPAVGTNLIAEPSPLVDRSTKAQHRFEDWPSSLGSRLHSKKPRVRFLRILIRTPHTERGDHLKTEGEILQFGTG